jgi:hypothetical protein
MMVFLVSAVAEVVIAFITDAPPLPCEPPP